MTRSWRGGTPRSTPFPCGASFVGSLLFALFAALATTPWMLLAGPFLGFDGALGAYLLLLVPVYCLWIAPSFSRSIVPALLLTALVGAAAWIGPTLPETVLFAAVVVGIVRGAFLYSRRPARALLVECFLLGGGIFLAWMFGAATLLGSALGVWTFFLVQSLFFLVSDAKARGGETRADPFDVAHRRALAVLDGT